MLIAIEEAAATLAKGYPYFSSRSGRHSCKDTTTNQLMVNSGKFYDDDFHTNIPPVPTFAIPNASYRTPPIGATVIPDEYEAYYRSLRPGQEPDPDRLVVADPVPIRFINALVDKNLKKECILDPGCQIIAMSEHTCHELALAYDPAIRLHMQSANGEVNWSPHDVVNTPH